jgi:Anaphase-promoting complex, cyclosome, subunit 3
MGAPGLAASSSSSSRSRVGPAPAATTTTATTAAAATSLSTYLSLIPQYLAVLAVDNATFLAERCVAQYPTSWDARYLWALCRYRCGEPGPALDVLAKSLPPPAAASSQDEQVYDSVRYLRATCWYELQDYAGAERALLQECRRLYRLYREQQADNQNSATAAQEAVSSMDDWILETTVCIHEYLLNLYYFSLTLSL